MQWERRRRQRKKTEPSGVGGGVHSWNDWWAKYSNFRFRRAGRVFPPRLRLVRSESLPFGRWQRNHQSSLRHPIAAGVHDEGAAWSRRVKLHHRPAPPPLVHQRGRKLFLSPRSCRRECVAYVAVFFGLRAHEEAVSRSARFRGIRQIVCSVYWLCVRRVARSECRERLFSRPLNNRHAGIVKRYYCFPLLRAFVIIRAPLNSTASSCWTPAPSGPPRRTDEEQRYRTCATRFSIKRVNE